MFVLSVHFFTDCTKTLFTILKITLLSVAVDKEVNKETILPKHRYK